ncbi:phage portal protein [Aminobacter sp. SR38]|jgi:HK97 family phage portal protein|uniref:phage portal protein n=1 Tax=Aminobacter sp. SR38 TaxID=2774562 RepID=UPI001786F725|nr:phage portal protein [Aminobacter sp. SR38]QOF71465.1 phage portal protein [Aminobacter sp. SR38]
MRLLGLPIPFTRQKAQNLASVADNRGWFRIFESWPGAWQHNVVVDRDLALSYHAVFACMTLIASDIAKLRVKYVEKDKDGIWTEVANSAYDPVLRKPNTYQNRIQFWESWVLSKLSRGNTYVLKVRDSRGVVAKLMVLDPNRVIPLVADSGDVYYRLDSDNIVGIEDSITVPASEIIHDRFNCLFHPLVGLSPLFAAGVAAMQGSRIQSNSAWFFGNKSQPGGILTAPGAIDDGTAQRLKEAWETKFTGENAGKIAVVGDGLKYEPIGMSAHDSQLIEQLKWTSEVICSVFHVPPYKIGVGQMPSYNNIQSLNVEYYSQCLQSHIEAGELCLDEGLEIKNGAGTEFEVDNLLRMDSITQMEVLDKSKGILSPNEQRAKLDKKPVKGGNSPMLQQQNFSLEALAKRDAQADPFGGPKPAAPAEPVANDNAEAEARAALVEIYKGLR